MSSPEMMSEFKTAVVKILTPHASAILLDPEYGLDAAKARASNSGLLLAYEESGYEVSRCDPALQLPERMVKWIGPSLADRVARMRDKIFPILQGLISDF